MTPEQEQVVRKCCRMLKRTMTDIKRVVFHLSPEKDKAGTVEYETHGKMKVEDK